MKMPNWKKSLSLLAAVACFGAIQARAQTLEIDYTGPSGSPLRVDRDVDFLELRERGYTSITLPDGLRSLKYLDLRLNSLTNLTLPGGLTSLESLDLSSNRKQSGHFGNYFWTSTLTSITLPAGLVSLETLWLSSNGLTNVVLPDDLGSLKTLYLQGNQLTSIVFPYNLSSLEFLNLSGNRLGSITLPDGLPSLEYLNLERNQLLSIILPDGLRRLSEIHLRGNQLVSVTLPNDLFRLYWLDLRNHPLTSVTLPGGLRSLRVLHLPPSLRRLQLPSGMHDRVGRIALNGSSANSLLSPDNLFFLEFYELPVSLSITRKDGGLEIAWRGVLQKSAEIEGPWQNVDETSPLQVSPSLPAEFFRVRAE